MKQHAVLGSTYIPKSLKWKDSYDSLANYPDEKFVCARIFLLDKAVLHPYYLPNR